MFAVDHYNIYNYFWTSKKKNHLQNQFRLGVIVAAALLSLQKTFVAVASLSHR